MKKELTLKENTAFKRAYFRGKFKAHPLLVTYVMKNRCGRMRIGITTSKKVGNAVKRSRARRVIRSAFDTMMKNGFSAVGYDIVFVARAATPGAKSYDIARVMKKQLHTLFAAKTASTSSKPQ
jgi:ribonuclease P protein component